MSMTGVTPLPRRGGALLEGTKTLCRRIGLCAREGSVTHLGTVLHTMEVRAIVAGAVLTCAGVALYLLFRRHSVIRNSVAPKTANVRVRPGQSYRQALQEGVKRQ